MPTSASPVRQLLCEGWAGAFTPEVVYCKQGDRVWYAKGSPDLHESTNLQIVESFEALELVERTLPTGRVILTPKDGVWVVEGPAQKSDTRNANRRTYPRSIWEKWIADPKSPAQVAIRERGMLGHLEHPGDGRTDGNKGALVCTHATLREDGVVWASFELLDTPSGLILQEYTRKKVKWGVSSRGMGSVDETGRVSPDDFVFECWDGVMRPSVIDAVPRLVASESVDQPAPARNAVDEAASGAATTLAPDVLRRVEEVEALCASEIDELDPLERDELRSQIREGVKFLQTATSHPRVGQAVTSAFWKFTALTESEGTTLDDLIESACREATASDFDNPRDDYMSVIETTRQRAEASASEAESLRAKLEEAESRSLALEWRVQELSEQLADARDSLTESRSRLKQAKALLAERATREVSGQVLEAVDDAVEQVPQLEPFRTLLEHANSDADVYDLAEMLLPVAVRQRERPAQPATPVTITEDYSRRATLPRGVVRSGNDVSAPLSESTSSAPSRGVALAARAVALAHKTS